MLFFSLPAMFVDIAPQQQLPEIFSTNRSHRRNSNAANARRAMDEELSKKAELILGQAPPPFDYDRQKSFDLCASWPSRELVTHPTVFVNTQSKSDTAAVDPLQKKDKPSVTVEQLVPLIFKVRALPTAFSIALYLLQVVRLLPLDKFSPIVFDKGHPSSFVGLHGSSDDEGEELSDEEEENGSESMAGNTTQQM